MANDNNPFKSIEEKFLERQRAKQKASKATGDWVGVIEAKKRMIDWINRINFKAQVT